ncbi:MAG TPA: polysaccharide deacetylase family protein [Acidimicrobiales bacterium]|nr:polysaccharide deacetylase family protein [Acidimicrobiales bacterium]
MAVRAVAGRGVKEAAALVDRVRRPGPGVVVLIYHRVGGGSGLEVDLPPGLFDEQMAALAASGAAATLDDALAALAAPAAERPAVDPVVVTFDDGTADLVDVALPVLARHRVPAVFYLSTDFVERGRDFPHDGRPLSWAGAREAVASGLVTLGSHTHTHALLDRLGPAEASDELDRSRDLIGERAGVAADHLAYPKAVPPAPAVEVLVRARFRSASLGGSRPNPYGATDPHRLARSAIQRSDGMRFFTRKAAGGMALEETARRVLNRLRYARASS